MSTSAFLLQTKPDIAHPFCIYYFFPILCSAHKKMEQYKDEIQKTFSFLLSPEIKWEFQGEGRYTWKTLTKQETLVSCDAHRLFLLLSDHHYITLYRWLPGARKDYEVAETYETE